MSPTIYAVYILYSPTLDRYYTGLSKFSAKRDRQHLRGQTHWTSRADDWEKVWSTKVMSLAEARTLEQHIKKRGAQRFLESASRPTFL